MGFLSSLHLVFFRAPFIKLFHNVLTDFRIIHSFFFFFFFLSFFCACVMCGICVVCIACNHQHSLYSHTNFVVWSRLLLLHHPTPIPTTTTPPALGSLCMVHQVPCSAWLHPEASVGPS